MEMSDAMPEEDDDEAGELEDEILDNVIDMSALNGKRRTSKLMKTPEKPAEGNSKNVVNLKDRLHLFYGKNDAALIAAFNERNTWASAVVFPDQSRCSYPHEREQLMQDSMSKSYDKETQVLIEKKMAEVERFLPRNNPISVQPSLESEFSTVELYNHISLPHESHNLKGFIVNVGGLVSSLSWAPEQDDPTRQFLAVGVVVDHDWTPSSTSSVKQEYSVFARTANYSSIQIYQVNTAHDDGNSVNLVATVCSNYGNVVQLAWKPGHAPRQRGDVGILAACFLDGRVRLFHIFTDSACVHYEMQRPLREYSLETAITCIAWRHDGILVVGSADGCIAEFDLYDSSPEGIYPSYVFPVHYSLVTSISTGYPNNNDLIYTTSTDGYNQLVDVKDIRRSQVISSRFKGYSTCSAYCYHINSFLSLEDAFTTKAAPIRKVNMLQGATTLTRHEGSITTLATSFLHPIALSGASDGTLQVGNYLRRVTISRRISNQVYKYGKLWTFQASERDGTFRFIDLFSPKEFVKQSASGRMTIYPRTVAITALDWNPSIVSANWYAAGLGAGLLRIEALG